jgi:hypothetical protein
LAQRETSICVASESAASRPLFEGYTRREPEKTILYRLVQQNLENFLAEHPGLPKFVEEEFRRYLDCGILAKGFVLLECVSCGERTAVAFSCKTQTFCPSCLTRRMHATAADLVDRVLPSAPYRHWVLAFPIRLRYLLARDETLLKELREIFVRSVFVWQRARARALGVKLGRSGAIAFTQRFSSRLLLFPHVHCVIPDGVFAQEKTGKIIFQEVKPKQEDIEKIVSRIARRAAKILAKLDTETLEPDALDTVRGLSQQGELAIKVESVEEVSGRMLASSEGFSLQAARHLHENDRAGLEFLVRYVLRPPLSLSRMSELPSGNIVIRFKHALANGMGAMELTPMALMRRLASLVPPPGAHDTSYFGIFASHAKLRRHIVRPAKKEPELCRSHPGCEEGHEEISTLPDPNDSLFGREDRLMEEKPHETYISWATLHRRTHGLDVLQCRCGGIRKIKSYMTNPKRIRQELEKLGLWSQAPQVARARRPAQGEMFEPAPDAYGVDPPAPDDAA